ncbi:MAG: O-antigen ligase family protein [Ignavibacterium sp.]|jgi:O-antigen ligase|nr:O-antigen ligase family protein [Ignavibacterium sp.]
MDSNKNYFLLYILSVALIISFSVIGKHQYALYLLIFGLVILTFINNKYIIFLTIVFLPTNGIFPREIYIGGVLGLKQILSFFVMIPLLLIKFNGKDKVEKKYLNSIIALLFVLTIYQTYTAIKNAIWGIGDTYNSDLATMKVIGIIALLVPLILIIKKSPIIKNEISIAVTYGIVNMSIFTFISPILPDLGLKSTGIVISEMTFDRFAGIMADGDTNTLGVFFAMSIGYLILKYQYYNNYILFTLICTSLFALALTGSRTAFFALTTVFLLFMLRKTKVKIKGKVLFFLLLTVVSTFSFWVILFERVLLSGLQLDTQTGANRIGKWILYFAFFEKNPLIYLRGTDKDIMITWNNAYYAAHNFYIQVIYNAGLIALFLFLLSYWKIYNSGKKLFSTIDFLFIAIPYLFITSFVSDIGIIYYALLYATLLPLRLYPNSKIVSNNNH